MFSRRLALPRTPHQATPRVLLTSAFSTTLSRTLASPTSRPSASSSESDGFSAPYHVGPYPIGAGMATPGFRQAARASRDERKKWGELSAGGKVWRATTTSGNLAFVTFGAGLLFVIAVSVGTELFSPNSSTVIFNKAVDRLENSDELKLYLLPPLFFHPPHASPTPSASRTSHARAQLSSIPASITRSPTTGAEVHTFGFLVEGQRPGDARSPTGWWGSARDQVKEGVERGWEGVKVGYGGLVEKGWAPEMPEPGKWLGLDGKAKDDKVGLKAEEEEAASGIGRLVGGLFGGIKRPSTEMDRRAMLPPLGTYTTGEVKVVCEKNPQTARLDIRSIQVYVPYAGAKNAYHFHVSPEGAHGPSVWSRVKGLLANEEEKVEEIAKE